MTRRRAASTLRGAVVHDTDRWRNTWRDLAGSPSPPTTTRTRASSATASRLAEEVNGLHSPAGKLAREQGDGIVIEPVFKDVSLASAEIIALARIDVVFAGMGTSKQGSAGTEVTIQTKPSSDLVWVGSTAGAVKIADGSYLKDQTPVYFRLSIAAFV